MILKASGGGINSCPVVTNSFKTLDLIVLLVVTVAGCTSQPAESDRIVHESLSPRVGVASAPSRVASFGIGFVRSEDRDMDPFERPQTEEFRLENGEPFAPHLILVNAADRAKSVLVSAILDYEQIPFELDGHYAVLHEITVSPETELEIPLNISLGKAGIHDLFVVAFKHPHYHPTSLDDRFTSDPYLIGRRTVIIVGDVEKPVRSVPSAIEGGSPPPGVILAPDVYPASITNGADTHPSERQMVLATGVAGEVFRYQLWVASKRSVPVRYAIIALLDYRQVPLNGQKLTIVHLTGGHQETVIDAELGLRADTGMHELQFVWVWDPYHSILNKEVYTPLVLASPRVGINVTADERNQ